MLVKIIDNFQQFDQLKPNWDEVYAADPQTAFFVSWPWLKGWFEMREVNWFVLSYRPHGASSYVAFLPLSINQSLHLAMGGNDYATYTGFVCMPEYQDEAIASFAGFIKSQIKWEEFKLKDVSDPRLDAFLSHFTLPKFAIKELDRLVCSYMSLPNTWTEYLKTIGPSTRKNIKSWIKKVESLDNYRITETHANNFEEQINTFFMLWQMRWGSRPDKYFKWWRICMRACLENDCLWLNIIWDGTVPLAGMWAYLDRDRSIYYASEVGRNDQYAKLNVGIVMFGYAIRYAIENGYKYLDFLKGDEDYKYHLGAINHFNRNVIVSRKDLRITARKMLRRGRSFANRVKSKLLNTLNKIDYFFVSLIVINVSFSNL